MPVGAHGGQLAARPTEHDNELAYHSVFAENLISRLENLPLLSCSILLRSAATFRTIMRGVLHKIVKSTCAGM